MVVKLKEAEVVMRVDPGSVGAGDAVRVGVLGLGDGNLDGGPCLCGDQLLHA